jgi:hypothetical protein
MPPVWLILSVLDDLCTIKAAIVVSLESRSAISGSMAALLRWPAKGKSRHGMPVSMAGDTYFHQSVCH